MKVEGKPPPFDPKIFLARLGAGKTMAELRKGQIVFAQGDPAAAVFYIQKGKIELRVLSRQGKEAILTVLGVDDFFGMPCGSAAAHGDGCRGHGVLDRASRKIGDDRGTPR